MDTPNLAAERLGFFKSSTFTARILLTIMLAYMLERKH